jgi:CRISPR-associated endonuclease Cas1
MPNQRTAHVETWPEEAKACQGVVVAGAYGVRISVWRGRLRVEDGVGRDRRDRLFHRATSGLKRLVVLGHTGYVSLEGLRWLADLKAAYLQIDVDGRVLATFGPPGSDRPTLRRAQAIASNDARAQELSKGLVDAKLAAQLVTLDQFSAQLETADARAVVDSYRQLAADATSTDELRASEAWAAGAYWQAFAPLAVRFARRDAELVPSHWRTFGGRSSPIANGPRMAGNPANAVLNYVYSLLEAEATLAARIVGLDPGLGFMHVDQAFRDSLAADLMEPIRRLADAFAFDLLSTRGLSARDFFERRDGVCRVTAPLTHELAESLPRWRQLVGKVAEDIARLVEPRGTNGRSAPTPISQRRRAAGRSKGPKASQAQRSVEAARACSWCGKPTMGGRKTCSDECKAQIQAEATARFAVASSTRMTQLHRSGHPARTIEADARRRATRNRLHQEQLAWEREHPGPHDQERFHRDIAPRLSRLSAGQLASATGLSASYWARVQREQSTPHPRWWRVISELAD